MSGDTQVYNPAHIVVLCLAIRLPCLSWSVSFSAAKPSKKKKKNQKHHLQWTPGVLQRAFSPCCSWVQINCGYILGEYISYWPASLGSTQHRFVLCVVSDTAAETQVNTRGRESTHVSLSFQTTINSSFTPFFVTSRLSLAPEQCLWLLPPPL